MVSTMTYLRNCITAATLLAGVLATTGCDSNRSTTSSDTSTTIKTSDAPTSPTPAFEYDARNGTRSNGIYGTNGHPTASDDDELTQSMVQISGKVTYADGPTVSTGTVTLTSYVISPSHGLKPHVAASAQIGPEGTYTLQAPEARYHTIRFKGEFPGTIEVLSGSEPSSTPKLRKVTKDMKVERGVEVTGRVIDENNQPVPDATVIVRKDSSSNHNPLATSHEETSSTAAGDFTIPFAASGDSLIIASHPDLASGYVEIELPSSQSVTIQMLRGGATISGHVYHHATGEPVENATITAEEKDPAQPYPKTATSAADGSFTIPHIKPGKIQVGLKMTDPTLAGFPQKDSILGKQIEMADKETTDVSLLVYAGHTVTGKVYDKDTMDPLGGAEVRFASSSRITTTTSAPDGTYTLNHVHIESAAHSARLEAVLDGYTRSVEKRDDLHAGNTIRLTTDDLNGYLDHPLVKTVSVSGVVKTPEGIPVPKASVQVLGSNSSFMGEPKIVETNDAGEYNLEIRPFYEAAIKAEARGYAASYSEGFYVDNEDINNVDVTLQIGASVAGVVVGPDDKPVAGANVYASSSVITGKSSTGDSHESVRSDASGAFLISNLPSPVQLGAMHDDFANVYGEQVTLTPGEARTGVKLQLGKSYTIQGRVLDSDNNPVSAYNVNASGSSYASDNTDNNGEFKLAKLSEGKYRLQAYGNLGLKFLENIDAGTTNVVMMLEKRNNIERPDQILMIGKVVDYTTSQPVTDFSIGNIAGETITKDESRPGYFTVPVYEKMRFGVEVQAPGYMDATVTVHAPGDQPSFEQVFPIGKGGAITGKIVEAGTDTPLPGILVLNWGKTRDEYDRRNVMPVSTTTSDNEGNFTLAPAPPGDNLIAVRPKEPLTEKFASATVEHDEIADAGTIELEAGGALYGTVTLGASKKPLGQATVTVYGSDANVPGASSYQKSITTGPDGTFRFDGLAPRNYTLMVRHYSVRESVTLAQAEEKQVDLNMGGVKVFGKITRGTVPVRANIEATQPGGQNEQLNTSVHNGVYELNGLQPGQWKFKILVYSNNSSRMHEESVAVPDTDSFEHNIALPDVSISGIVVDPDGKPVHDAQAMLSQKQTSAGAGDGWRGGYNATARTDAEGRFSFTGLTEGTYQVVARKDAIGSAMEPAVQARDGKPAELKLELNPNGGTLVSVALNMATGHGLADAWCYLYSEHGRFTHAAQRNAEGVMEIKNIPPGTYRTNVSFWGYSQSEQEVEIKAGETATIEDVLYPAGAIEWTLQNADGSPAKATGTATPLDPDSFEEPKSGTTDGVGKLVIRGLAPGNYSVTAQAEGKPAVTDTFTVVAADIARKTIAVPGW